MSTATSTEPTTATPGAARTEASTGHRPAAPARPTPLERRPASRATGVLLVVLASACFAGSGPLVKPAMDAGLAPRQVASMRIALAAAILLGYGITCRREQLRIRRHDLKLLAGYGFGAVAGAQFLYFAAVSRIPIGVAMLLEFTAPVLVTLWVRVVRRTVLPKRTWVGVGLALAGLSLVAEVWGGLHLDALGLLFAAGAAFCAAAYFLIGSHAVTTMPALALVTWGMVVGAVAMALVSPPWSWPLATLGHTARFAGHATPVWLLVVACSIVSTAVPYVLSISAMRHLPANVVSVLAFCEPIAATVLAWLALGQAFTVTQMIGAAIVLTGAYTVQTASATR